jgi:acetylornithine deacetylase/succinyl-diaminopimelate desuccinylase-like protein
MHRFWLLLLVAAGWWSLRSLGPPAPVGKEAPATEFSSARAKRHIENIAARPHPMGTAAHAEAREYLLAELRLLGGEPQVQRGTAVRGFRVGHVENLVARWKGRHGGKAVLLMSHYDSVSTAPGASDAASGVAAILEAVRALRSGPPFRNDLMVLFTDGEEAGLLGATLFMSEHPWAREVGVVLNFEARGSGGSATMFETSQRNGWLIGEFAAAAPHRLANSLA